MILKYKGNSRHDPNLEMYIGNNISSWTIEQIYITEKVICYTSIKHKRFRMSICLSVHLSVRLT